MRVRGTITFLPKSAGGRSTTALDGLKSQLRVGSLFTTCIVRSRSGLTSLPLGIPLEVELELPLWSQLVRWAAENPAEAIKYFLEKHPTDWLRPGDSIELSEGDRVVARGEITAVFLDQWQEFGDDPIPVNAERRFVIQTSEPDFYTGITAQGHQVLMGCLCADFVFLLEFSGDGAFIQRVQEPIRYSGPTVLDPCEPEFLASVNDAIRRLRERLGIMPAPVRVQKFNDEGIIVSELPDYLTGEDQSAELIDERNKWREKGMFVLWWGKDFWMDADGSVDST